MEIEIPNLIYPSMNFENQFYTLNINLLFYLIPRRILKNQPLIPNYLSKVAKDFILKLLTKNPKRRLGTKGVDDVKRHPFFGSDMDWNAIANKRIDVPIKPKLKDEMDTSNFADEFTRLPLIESPGLAPPTESIFRVNYHLSSNIIFQLTSILIILSM